jgi:hypothetical protein
MRAASAEERLWFFAAYEKAQAEVTWVEVTVCVAGARVTLDVKPKNPEGHTQFFTFIAPGEHTLRASAEGYEDAFVQFTAVKGARINVPWC